MPNDITRGITKLKKARECWTLGEGLFVGFGKIFEIGITGIDLKIEAQRFLWVFCPHFQGFEAGVIVCDAKTVYCLLAHQPCFVDYGQGLCGWAKAQTGTNTIQVVTVYDRNAQ